MICWWCHWGWPKPVADIYDRAEKAIDALLDGWPDEKNDWTYPEWPSSGKSALEFGPGHVVWSDENWDSARWCLDHFNEYLDETCPPSIATIIRRSLEELAAMPVMAWDVVPSDYDGKNPQNYPPPTGCEMVRK